MDSTAKLRLKELYSLPEQLTEAQIQEALKIIDATDARSYVLSYIEKYTKQAQKAARSLSVSDHTRSFLLDIVELLVPEIAERTNQA